VGQISATQVLTLSDKRLKDGITIIESPLTLLDNIRGYSYVLTLDQSATYGLLAQEVEKMLPYAVSTDDN
jgi:Chaperone of endosialidase